MKTVKLRVKASAGLPLPFIVLYMDGPPGGRVQQKAVFSPDAEVPEAYADALLKTYPNRYEPAVGEPDLDKYTYSEDFKNKTLADLIAELNDDEKGKVYEFIEKMKAARAKKEAEAKKAKEQELLDAAKKAEEDAKKAQKAKERESAHTAGGGKGPSA